MATSRLSTRRVDWRVQVGTSNKAAQGLVIFEASVSYIPDPLAAGGPRTAIPEPVPAVLDTSGYACTPDPANPASAGERGVNLFTTDSLGEDGGDWTWTARPQLRSVNGIQMANAVPAFSFAVPTGTSSLDLATVQRVPASPGLGTEAAVALVARAEKAAQDALAVVQDTVEEVAEAAVDGYISTLDVVAGGDPRLISITEDSSIVYATIDSNNRRLWLEAGHDGGPTEYAGKKIGASPAVIEPVAKAVGVGQFDPSASELSFALIDKNGRRLELEMDARGRVTDRVLSAWAGRMGATGNTSIPDYPTQDWAHWGDSMTASGFPAILAGFTRRKHFNGGWAGQTTTQIAARQGGTPALVTLAGNEIPAQGAVAVAEIRGAPTSASSNVSGALAGIPGTLTQNDSSGYTFTRTTAGNATTVPPKSQFLTTDSAAYRDRVVTIWCGRNGVQYGEKPELIVGRIRSMMDYLTPRVRRVIVMQIAPNDTETPGTAGRALVDAANDLIAKSFPSEYLAIADYLRTPTAATAAGITFTADDQADIANKITPRSLRLPGDNLHLNTAGNTAVAKRVLTEAQNKGWI